MKCSLARDWLDDFLDGGLNSQDRTRLEGHLASCPGCAGELCRRSAFEHTLRQALGASVQQRVLPPGASGVLIHQAQEGLSRAIWSSRIEAAARVVGRLAALALVFFGLYFLAARIPLPRDLGPITLLPVQKLFQNWQRPAAIRSADESDPLEMQPLAGAAEEALRGGLLSADIIVEPIHLRPGDRFTMTLFLHNDLPHSLRSVRFDLEINGPTGYYRFPLVADGPFPAGVVSLLKVTPEFLAAPCQEKYLISPLDIFAKPGIYTLRFTLYNPVTLSRE